MKMHDACVKDERAFQKGEPAMNKLQLLPKVQQVVAMKTLQHNLLEKDVLGAFRDWIEPKRDGQRTLASLTVRTAVYEMLGKLPCQIDHLKFASSNKRPIGHVILELRKHKDETTDNKRVLKELMEKWCRPVFRKVGVRLRVCACVCLSVFL
jgi:transcription factor SPN1